MSQKIDWTSDAALLRACELVYCNGDHWAWGRKPAEERALLELELKRTLKALEPMLNS